MTGVADPDGGADDTGGAVPAVDGAAGVDGGVGLPGPDDAEPCGAPVVGAPVIGAPVADAPVDDAFVNGAPVVPDGVPPGNVEGDGEAGCAGAGVGPVRAIAAVASALPVDGVLIPCGAGAPPCAEGPLVAEGGDADGVAFPGGGAFGPAVGGGGALPVGSSVGGETDGETGCEEGCTAAESVVTSCAATFCGSVAIGAGGGVLAGACPVGGGSVVACPEPCEPVDSAPGAGWPGGIWPAEGAPEDGDPAVCAVTMRRGSAPPFSTVIFTVAPSGNGVVGFTSIGPSRVASRTLPSSDCATTFACRTWPVLSVGASDVDAVCPRACALTRFTFRSQVSVVPEGNVLTL